MIQKIIALSVRNRGLVLLITAVVVFLGGRALVELRLDALPDLSDVQVIVVTDYPGQSSEVIEDEVTHPLASALLSVPGAKTVRGFSMYELSFVYLLFDDDTDLYWARSRVAEQLSAARDLLPDGVRPRLGPDATGVGWVYQYVVYPGFYCPDHRHGLWHDREHDLWYERSHHAPLPQQEALRFVNGFEHPGACPIDDQPLERSPRHLGDLRSLQDWTLKSPLTSVPGVAEVASFGGFVRQYQVVVDPIALQAYDVTVAAIVRAIERSNDDAGASVIEWSEIEYMVRGRGRLQDIDDLRSVPVAHRTDGVPIFLRDVATVRIGGAPRRGIGEYGGLGEAVGGIVIARVGENAYQVVEALKAEIAELAPTLPPGIILIPTYDRSALIAQAVTTLSWAVVEELLIVGLICLLFLFHVRSALVAIIALPIGLLTAVFLMQLLEMNANIMSLGGLALAIGVMVDSAMIMIENANRMLEAEGRKPADVPRRSRDAIIIEAAQEVGPSLFASLLVIALSFLPILYLGGESGRLFRPLAYTKTFAMVSAAVLGITLVPVLMVLFIRGRMPAEQRNPVNRLVLAMYEPVFRLAMGHPKTTLLATLMLGLSAIYPVLHLGEEFMPPLDEGDLVYMPTTDPGISGTKAGELLQQTNKLIATFPEVLHVHGKAGRADTATDPAPLSMIETTLQLHPDRERWRHRPVRYFFSDWPGWLHWPFTSTFWPASRPISIDELKYGWTDPDGEHHAGLNDVVDFPGLANSWPFPIESRLTMLSTGIKTPIGVKIVGPELDEVGRLASMTAFALQSIRGTANAYAVKTDGGFHLDLDIDRERAARYGLTTGDVQDAIQVAVGGRTVTHLVDGVERMPVSVRYPRELRDSIPALEQILIATPEGGRVPLGDLAEIAIEPSAPMIRSENAQLSAWVFVDIEGRDLGGYLREARRVIAKDVRMPEGYSRVWSGRFEALESANRHLAYILPITIVVIITLLYVANRSWLRVGIVLLAVPFSLIGAFWFLWALDYNMSLAVWVGIIALMGVDAETGQVMLLYLHRSCERFHDEGRLRTRQDLYEAIHEGAVKRIRPKAMTVATSMIGLLPLLWASGLGGDVTRRMAAPLVGGIAVSFVMELVVYPVIFQMAQTRRLPAAAARD